ncbi:MAG: hypothetical protein KGI27_10155 [Thaumarchaeota archaeon]|nr:hypothetical protein [Nitrososphaerota archaeon]
MSVGGVSPSITMLLYLSMDSTCARPVGNGGRVLGSRCGHGVGLNATQRGHS